MASRNPVAMAESAGESVERLFTMMQGYMASAALRAGLELEVFTHISKGADTAEQLAEAKKTSVRAMRILCDSLVAFGVLGKADGRYKLPSASAMALVKGSPAYIGAFSKVTLNSVMWEQAGRLSEIVKAGHSLLEHDAETPDNPFWHDFQRASRQIAGMTGAVIADIAASLFPPAGPKRILDIACGSGLYGFSMLKRFEDARLVSMDWPGVLELTRPIAEQMGLSNRVEFRPGDIFKDELGSGYDLIIAANIYHHFNPDKNRKLSRRLFEAAAPGAILIIVDMIPDENREKANFQLTFALTMLIWTQEGDTYTLSEYERMLAPVGWRDIMLKEVPGGPRVTQAVIARKSTGT